MTCNFFSGWETKALTRDDLSSFKLNVDFKTWSTSCTSQNGLVFLKHHLEDLSLNFMIRLVAFLFIHNRNCLIYYYTLPMRPCYWHFLESDFAFKISCTFKISYPAALSLLAYQQVCASENASIKRMKQIIIDLETYAAVSILIGMAKFLSLNFK